MTDADHTTGKRDATVSVHKSSIRFTINKKKVSLDVDMFREILQFCPKIPRQKFKDLPLEHDILSFIRDLGHSRDIICLTDVNVDYLDQPWRAFATIINKCLSGKETGMEKIRLSHAQILWGMFYKKNIDYVYLLWEDFLFQIEYKDAKNTNKMSYPRFIKIIIDYFMSKDQSISRRNKMSWHTARDDNMFTSMRCISRHEDTQVYCTILPTKLTNQAMLESKAYQTYYAFASGEKAPKPKYIRKKADSDTSPKKKPVQATKGTRLKSKAKVAKPDKKKQPTKKTKAKGLDVLSEVALTKAEQIKLATKRSKKDFHVSHASGSGDGVDTQVLDVPLYEFESDKESWEDEDNNDDDGDNDHDDDSDDERTKSDRDEIPDLKLTNVDQTEHEEEEYDDEFYEEEEEEEEKTMDDEEVIKELYGDVNVNLGNDDTEMTDADQGDLEQQNVSQESGFEQEEEDAHLLNHDNPSLADNEIASLIDITAQHATLIPEITSSFTTTVPPPPPFFDQRVSALESKMSELRKTNQFAEAVSSILGIVDTYLASKMKEAVDVAVQLQTNKLREEAQAENQEFLNQVDSTMKTIIKDQVKAQVSKIMPKIEKYVTESLGAEVLVRSTNQPQTAYAVAASLSEFELKKILIDKMEANKSINRSDNQKNLYNALVESYNSDKDIITSYGDVVLLKRGRDDQDKDEDPSAGSDRGTKRRKSGKDVESSKDSRKSAHAKEPSHTVEDSGMQQDQEFVTGDNDEQPADKEVTKADWFKKPERPPTPDPDWSKRRQVDFRPPQTWISQAALAEEPPTSFDEFNDTSFDFSTFVMNRLKIPNLTQEILVGPAFNLLKGTCKSITELEYHLEECSKATTERLDWHNPENRPYSFDLRNPLPLIQDHRGRQIIPKDYFINKVLEYLKGGELSGRYSTSVTKTKATTYDLKWIEDLVQEVWSPVQ
ncbi:hypothetical protein Tco_1326134, partial [Tanacetum coccineum]